MAGERGTGPQREGRAGSGRAATAAGEGPGVGPRSQALCPVRLHVGDQGTPPQPQDAAGWPPGDTPDACVRGRNNQATRGKPARAAAGARDMPRVPDSPSQRAQVLTREGPSPHSAAPPAPDRGGAASWGGGGGRDRPALGGSASGLWRAEPQPSGSWEAWMPWPDSVLGTC